MFFSGYDASKLNAKWDETKSITVSNDVQKELLSVAKECSDNIATSSIAQGQAVIEYLGKRPAVVGQNLIGSVTAASRFEDSFAGIKKTVEASEAEFDSLAMSIRDMALEIPVATSELNAIGELGGQLGIAVQNLPLNDVKN